MPDSYTLVLTPDETQAVIDALVERPYKQVAQILAGVIEQVNAQKAAEAAESAATMKTAGA